jgi:hypothetical protein
MSMTMEEYEKFKQGYFRQHWYKDNGMDEQPKLKAQITAQQDALGANISRLEAVIDTLAHRLQPVLLDAPSVCRSEELEGGMSPVALALCEANRRITRASDNLQDLLERLEV